MVLYLGINYLDQAVAQRHQLLSKCLIQVPHHLDAVESYPHRGNLPDVKYRFPWKRAKVDETFLEKEITQIRKDISLSDQEKSKDVLIVEYFESPCITNGSSFCETVNFDLNCDVVCSSNPSSLEECFSPDEFFSEPQLFTEIFFKENIEKLRPDCEVLMLEETIREDAFLPEGLKRIQTLAHLVSKFTPEHVEDPLLLASGAKILTQHDKMLDGEDSVVDTCMLIEKINSSLFHDDWSVDKKQPDRLQDPEKESLEDVIVVDECLYAEKEKPCQSQLLDYLVSPQEILKIQFDQDVKDVIGRTFRLPATKTIGELESLDWKSNQIQMIDFVGINEIIVTAQDKFCEVAYIAIPEEEVPELKCLALSIPDQKPFEVDMACKSVKNLLLTEEERSRVEKIVWLEEKYFDDVQASRLPEPEAADACLSVPQNMVILTSKTLKISEEASLGKLDLALSWEVVPCSATPENPCKRLVDIGIDSTYFEVNVAEVEPIQAYDREFMFDWEDKLMKVEDDKQVRKSEVKERGMEGGPFETYGSKPVNLLKTVGKGRESHKRGFDALESFLALRSKSVAFPRVGENTREPVKSKENGNSAALVEISGIDRFSDTRAVVSKKAEIARKVKHHTVKIPLSNFLLDIHQMFKNASLENIRFLIEAGSISEGSKFRNMTPDKTRFLVKQRERFLADNNVDQNKDAIFQNLLCLHGRVGAADIAVNFCIESAITYLNALQDKYTFISGSFDTIRERLFEIKAGFIQDHTQHPKLSALCKEIDTWLKKKRAKSKDQEQKILVLVKRDMPNLLVTLRDMLSLGKMLSPVVLQTTMSENIIELLDQHNILIAQQNFITEHFPWAQFCLVVEYERDENTQWQQLCERQSIRHIDMQVDFIDDQSASGNLSFHHWTMEYPEKQITLIACSKVIENTTLLHLLETRYNILLVERDYRIIPGTSHLHFSDLDIDENTCVVFENFNTMGDDSIVQNIVTRIACLSLKYTTCWLVTFPDEKTKSYEYPGHVISNFARLHAALSNLARKHSLTCKIIQCDNTNDVAGVVRHVCETCMTTDENRSISQWLDRRWISQHTSQTEKFMLTVPSFNSMSAQSLMRSIPINGLFSASTETIKHYAKWISDKVLQTFFSVTESTTGVHLGEETEKDDIEIVSTKRCPVNAAIDVNGCTERANEIRTPTSEEASQYTDQTAVGTAPLMPTECMINDRQSKITIEYNHGQVFDYNHGLSRPSVATPIIEQKVFNQSNKHYRADYSQNLRKVEEEFPSAEEIDKSIAQDNDCQAQQKGMLNGPFSDLSYDTPPRWLQPVKELDERDDMANERENLMDHDTRSVYFQQGSENKTTENPKAFDMASYTSDNIVNFNTNLLIDRKRRMNAKVHQEVKFEFNPQIHDKTSDSVTYENSYPKAQYVDHLFEKKIEQNACGQDKSDELYVNPTLERITLKHEYSGQQPCNNKPGTISFEDELRETTRKLIENSQQFSQFVPRSFRFPFQKVNIGLAQPLQRPKQTESNVENVSALTNEERHRMVQSPWATENSPPMDLDYDDQQTLSALYPEIYNPGGTMDDRCPTAESNPQKRRRLAFQKIPGCKGQTKLIFR